MVVIQRSEPNPNKSAVRGISDVLHGTSDD
jgi:hypothetical protein